MEDKKNVLLPQYSVEGFDPNKALTIVQEVDEKGEVKESLFMRYAPSLAWFLTVFPDGCLNHTFVVLNDKKATVTASIYRHASDPRPAATATCSRFYDESPNGPFYEQNAVTAAYRKALDYLGFGTPLDAHVVEGQQVVSGNEVPEKSEPGVEISIPRPSARNIESLEIEPEAAETVQEQKDEPAAVPAPPKPKASTKASASEKIPTTIDEAMKVTFPMGELRGKTIEDGVREKGKSYIRWWADKTKTGRYKGTAFAAAVQLYCEFEGC